MDDHDLIMAMGEKGLGITLSGNKNWTQVSKAKRVCNSGKRNPNPENQKKFKCKKKGQKPGCHKPTPLRVNLVLEIWLLREQIGLCRSQKFFSFPGSLCLSVVIP